MIREFCEIFAWLVNWTRLPSSGEYLLVILMLPVTNYAKSPSNGCSFDVMLALWTADCGMRSESLQFARFNLKYLNQGEEQVVHVSWSNNIYYLIELACYNQL